MGAAIARLCFFHTKKENLDDIPNSFFDIKLKDIEGKPVDFASFKGKYKAFICVNVASACGLTNSNYTQLVKLHNEFASKGLKIMGFPCNQFMSQEKKCELDILEFARAKFHVEFQLLQKIEVNGPNCHPLYKFLRRNSELYDPKTGKTSEIEWNFGKFILNEDGKVIAFKKPTEKPESFRPLISELVNT